VPEALFRWFESTLPTATGKSMTKENGNEEKVEESKQ